MRCSAVSLALLTTSLAACQFTPDNSGVQGDAGSGIDAPGIVDAAPPGSDAPVDAGIDAPPSITCFASGVGVTACLQGVPPMLDVSATKTTDTGATSTDCAKLAAGSVGDVCVVAAHGITLEPGVRWSATGARPLVIISDADISILGTLDLSSTAAVAGAGGEMTGCSVAGAPTGGAGGAGGSFGEPGGDGGRDSNNAVGGTAGATIGTDALRGGCPGEVGAGANTRPGKGGGAVLVIATGTLTIQGAIDTSGGGADGGNATNHGGNGGGAGGMIVLQAATIVPSVTAQVFANGGGGSEGGSNKQGGNGATSPMFNAGGPGGGGQSNAGDGGGGSPAPTLGRTGFTGTAGDGGGGGGGGGGVVDVFTNTPPDVSRFSPAPTISALPAPNS